MELLTPSKTFQTSLTFQTIPRHVAFFRTFECPDQGRFLKNSMGGVFPHIQMSGKRWLRTECVRDQTFSGLSNVQKQTSISTTSLNHLRFLELSCHGRGLVGGPVGFIYQPGWLSFNHDWARGPEPGAGGPRGWGPGGPRAGGPRGWNPCGAVTRWKCTRDGGMMIHSVHWVTSTPIAHYRGECICIYVYIYIV